MAAAAVAGDSDDSDVVAVADMTLLFLLTCIYPLTPPPRPKHIPLPRFPLLLSGATFSTPAFSAPPCPATPVLWRLVLVVYGVNPAAKQAD